jgi:hypothetical protein
MMKYITRLEKNVPVPTSSFRFTISPLVAPSRCHEHAPPHRLFVFYFLRRLPKEQVRADRRTENRHEHSPGFTSLRPARNKSGTHDCAPIGLQHERRDDVSEETRRKPFQDSGNLIVATANGGEGDDDAEEHHVIVRIKAGKHFRTIGHAGEIGANVDRIRSEECNRHARHDPFRELLPERSAQPCARHHSDARTHHLHRRHQRPGEARGPKHGGAKLRSRHRVSGNAGRIVIGRAGDKAGTETGKETNNRIPGSGRCGHFQLEQRCAAVRKDSARFASCSLEPLKCRAWKT